MKRILLFAFASMAALFGLAHAADRGTPPEAKAMLSKAVCGVGAYKE